MFLTMAKNFIALGRISNPSAPNIRICNPERITNAYVQCRWIANPPERIIR
jgi:hypothetical protein